MIYIIEDDENIRNLVQVALNGSGYETAAFETAEEALGAFKVKAPQLAIFDLMLPGMDGLEAIRKIRANDAWKKLPVLVLTAKDKEYDKVAGLDGGADDYMTKPFSVLELLARVRSLLRRTKEEEPEQPKLFDCGALHLDLETREVKVNGREVLLTYKEYELLIWQKIRTVWYRGMSFWISFGTGERTWRQEHLIFISKPFARSWGKRRDTTLKRCAASATVL